MWKKVINKKAFEKDFNLFKKEFCKIFKMINTFLSECKYNDLSHYILKNTPGKPRRICIRGKRIIINLNINIFAKLFIDKFILHAFLLLFCIFLLLCGNFIAQQELKEDNYFAQSVLIL